MDRTIYITEVGLRDGLQNIKKIIPTKDKLSILQSLIESGIKRIQVTSFVNRKLIPQMADAEELISYLPVNNDIQYSCLILNQKGLERAIKSGIKHIDFSISSSESYSKKNTRMSIKEALFYLKKMIIKAKKNDINVRAGIQCVWGCVYDGVPDQNNILKMIDDILEMKPDVISLADSTGMATPSAISNLLNEILKVNPNITLNLHLHDTIGLGLENLFTALSFGVNHFDSSFGGIGGSPFIKGSTGNISTEKTVHLLKKMGYKSGINEKLVSQISLCFKRKYNIK